MGRAATIQRETLLDAAEAVVGEQGAGRLTLDAVARKAGVSKGGLLHAYPSKDTLVSAMLERLVNRTQTAIEARKAELEGQDNVALRAYLAGAFATADVDPATATGLLAALPEHPRMLDPLRSFYQAHVTRIAAEAGDDPAALATWAAAEGLLLLEVLGVSPLSEAQRDALGKHLFIQAGEEQ